MFLAKFPPPTATVLLSVILCRSIIQEISNETTDYLIRRARGTAGLEIINRLLNKLPSKMRTNENQDDQNNREPLLS